MGNGSTKIEYTYDEKYRLLCKEEIKKSNTSTVCISNAIETNSVVFTTEEWEQIKKDGYKDIDFCMIPGITGTPECTGLFQLDNETVASALDEYHVAYSPDECSSFIYRPGMVIPELDDDAKSWFGNTIVKGNKCRIVYQDYDYDNDDLVRCCSTSDHQKCNKNLINNYETRHCDITMSTVCKDNPESSFCIDWLMNTTKRFNVIALDTYVDYCKENFDNEICSYFCIAARDNKDYKSSYCDVALETWCEKNKQSSYCFCYNTPGVKIPEIEQYLGPKECWLKECASEPDLKWLTTDQLDVKNQCEVTSCIIDVGSLMLKDNATASFVNDCISGLQTNAETILNSDDYEKDLETKYTPGILFDPIIFFMSAIGIFLCSILSYDNIYFSLSRLFHPQ